MKVEVIYCGRLVWRTEAGDREQARMRAQGGGHLVHRVTERDDVIRVHSRAYPPTRSSAASSTRTSTGGSTTGARRHGSPRSTGPTTRGTSRASDTSGKQAGTHRDQVMQLGNAICPPMAYEVIKQAVC